MSLPRAPDGQVVNTWLHAVISNALNEELEAKFTLFWVSLQLPTLHSGVPKNAVNSVVLVYPKCGWISPVEDSRVPI